MCDGCVEVLLLSPEAAKEEAHSLSKLDRHRHVRGCTHYHSVTDVSIGPDCEGSRRTYTSKRLDKILPIREVCTMTTFLSMRAMMATMSSTALLGEALAPDTQAKKERPPTQTWH